MTLLPLPPNPPLGFGGRKQRGKGTKKKRNPANFMIWQQGAHGWEDDGDCVSWRKAGCLRTHSILVRCWLRMKKVFRKNTRTEVPYFCPFRAWRGVFFLYPRRCLGLFVYWPFRPLSINGKFNKLRLNGIPCGDLYCINDLLLNGIPYGNLYCDSFY